MKQRYRRNILVLLFIIIAAIIVLIYEHSYEVNKIYNIEDSNAYYWQKYMNEEEFAKLKNGMSYMDVVGIAKGGGEQVSAGVFRWDDELLMTQGYEIHFENDKLIDKKIYEKRGYSTR
ncbi:hypothetical protein U5N28_03660 [Lysinibacillus telephonicus]|uniref:Uncharacterized protein n=1 Tax=Lysinibacillus telephonicus TaxID=1714840 RepID=A0A431UTC9_9BACI|nr:hypothetical protein [Lysinibacillus telephonicus]RTQ93925.1 hypothetical protein EKG35_07350 [Lysinibacillus telephonicus]